MRGANATTFGYAYQYGNFTKDECEPLEVEINRLREEFNKKSKLITVYIFSNSGVQSAFRGDVFADLALVQISV